MEIFVQALFFIFIATVTYIGTGALLPFLRSRAILDHPNERSSHKTPTPKGGGLSLMAVVLLAWIMTGLYLECNALLTWGLPCAALLLAGLSWVDDLRNLPPIFRFTAQVIAVSTVLLLRPTPDSFFQNLLPPALDTLLAGIIWVWFINLFNFMDGIDGITSVETIVIGVGVFLISDGPTAFLGGILAAAATGFLKWNWNPAKVFLGDVGSIPLGFLLGWLLLNLAGNGNWAAAIILPAYYLTDATITLIGRAIKGEKLWQAHRQHFYQKAVQRGLSHEYVATMVAFLGAVLIMLAWLAEQGQSLTAIITTLTITMFFLLILKGK
ncbi:MAG: glycosyl transferase [Magnetovibrio sp.]|mgnify:CR=1 FL=1|nr:glycosyl transferase [Magnetovibrio sp.]